jgi:hypothetical protein
MPKNQDRVQFYYRALFVLITLMVVFGWAGVWYQRVTLEQASKEAFQSAALEIVQGLGVAAQTYVSQQLNELGRPVSDLPQIAQEAQRELFSVVRLLVDAGDPWIIGADNTMAFDESDNFEYFGIPIDQFLELQAAKPNGAQSYQGMLGDVINRSEGVGEYIWENNTVEIGAWTPVMIHEESGTEWMIGITTPLAAVLQAAGVDDATRTSVIVMGVVTVIVLAVVIGLRLSLREVRDLQAQVQQLQIQIDTQKRDTEVRDIVESEYFQQLSSRAKELRARARRATP